MKLGCWRRLYSLLTDLLGPMFSIFHTMICFSFYFEVRVTGYDFIGYGEARSKKEAQAQATQRFCGFLIEQGLIPPDAVNVDQPAKARNIREATVEPLL